jgi:hypothetical protein
MGIKRLDEPGYAGIFGVLTEKINEIIDKLNEDKVKSP